MPYIFNEMNFLDNQGNSTTLTENAESGTTPLWWMRDYLWYDLFGRGLDADGYTDYFLSLLDALSLLPPDEGHNSGDNEGEGNALEQFLIACGLTNDDAISIVKKWKEISIRGYLTTEEQEWVMQQYQHYCSYTGAITDTFGNHTGIEVDQPTIDEQQALLEIENELQQEEQQEQELQGELLDEFEQLEYGEVVDWFALIEEVEMILGRDYNWHEPAFSPDALFQALSISGPDNPAYAAKLLYHAGKMLSTGSSEDSKGSSRPPPCRHALQGKCLLRNCPFDHNFAEMPCRFWLHSTCTYATGANNTNTNATIGGCCPFLHDIPIVEWSKQESDREKARDQPVEEAFPTLSSGVANKGNKSGTITGTGAGKRYVNAVKKSSFLYSHQQASSYADAALNPSIAAYTSSSSKYGNRYEHSGNAGFSDILALHHFTTVSAASRNGLGLRASVDIKEWVVSGSELREDYEQLRQEARQYAIARNKFLQEATQAYMSGSRNTAKVLSQRGQELNRQMKECHLLAAKAIFRKRNPLSDLLEGRIDLHGLHATEALDCLDELIPLYEKAKYAKIKVITGTGHHTKETLQTKSRLNHVVREYLSTEIYCKFIDIIDKSGYSGGFLVTL